MRVPIVPIEASIQITGPEFLPSIAIAVLLSASGLADIAGCPLVLKDDSPYAGDLMEAGQAIRAAKLPSHHAPPSLLTTQPVSVSHEF